jgi:hypothetical protein
VLLSDIEKGGTDGYQPIRDLRRRPSRQGESVPPAELIAVVVSLATGRR